MFRSPINFFIFINFLLLLGVIFACGFVDLKPIRYSVEPHGFDDVLDSPDSPLIVSFDTEMYKKDAEDIFLVSSDLGPVRGDFRWNENNLNFVPVSGWTAGIKYTLNLNGTIRAKDGRELRLQHFVSFYSVSKDPPPVLERHYPADGESVGTNDFILELHFSETMDRFSVESALSIDGVSNKSFEWEKEDKVIKVTSGKPLAVWRSYNWNLKDTAKNINGMPIPKQYSGSFTTNLDKTFPKVVRVYPVIYSNGWRAISTDIKTGLSSGEGIAVEFNKAMDESVLRSMRFEPSLSGRTEMLALNTVVYIFTKNPEPETKYTLIVSKDLKDTEGLKTDSEYRVSFTSDIPYLKVLSITYGNNYSISNFSSDTVLPVTVDKVIGKTEFSIRFSLSLNNEEKQNITQRIILSPFFPNTLPPIALQFVNWFSNDRILIRWEGLQAGTKGEKNYYKLTIPGGRSGITAGGLYMKEDFTVYLEAL